MFSRISTMKSTTACCGNIGRLRQELETADAVVIGAGSGLSTSAGFTYTGERFQKHFGDFIEKYGFRDMYSGGFYPFGSLEEHWAYWSRYIFINRYMDAPKPVYVIGSEVPIPGGAQENEDSVTVTFEIK